MSHTTIIIHTNSAETSGEVSVGGSTSSQVQWSIPHDMSDVEIAKHFIRLLQRVRGLDAHGP